MKKIRSISLSEYADGTWMIEETTANSVFPKTHKATAKEAAARLLQLMGLGPTAPQGHPEPKGISFDHDDEAHGCPQCRGSFSASPVLAICPWCKRSLPPRDPVS